VQPELSGKVVGEFHLEATPVRYPFRFANDAESNE
jgi:hypothetical protein